MPKTTDEGQKTLTIARWFIDRTSDRRRPSADRGGSLETRSAVEKVYPAASKDLEGSP